MTDQSTIRSLVKKYQELKKGNDFFHKKHIKDYDVFKRYTSSTSESSPQQKACHNVRKNWALTCRKNDLIPHTFQGVLLKDQYKEIGSIDRVRCSILAPDYYYKFGEPCSVETADVLCMLEKERVERFFSQSYEKLYFGKFYPHRQPVNIMPLVADVSKSSIASTILAALLPNYTSPSNLKKSNPNAVEKLKKKLLTPDLKKSLTAIIHMARRMITPVTRWLPTTVEHNAYTAEIVHMISSPYHLMPVSRIEDPDSMRFESLFYSLIQAALNSDHPKNTFISNLSNIYIGEQSLMQYSSEIPGNGPCTSIVKALCGGKVDEKMRVRSTIFQDVDTTYQMQVEKRRCSVLNSGYDYYYTWFSGTKTTYFTSGTTRGYVITHNKVILSIKLLSEEGTFLLDCLLDIAYHFKSIEPGFDKDFDHYVKPKERFETFFHHHVKIGGHAIREKLGMTEKESITTADFFYGRKGKIYLKNVSRMENTVQPYSNEEGKYTVNEDLKVFKVVDTSIKLIIDPKEISPIRPDIIPQGIQLRDHSLIYLYQNPQVRMKMLFEKGIEDPKRAESIVDDLMSEGPNNTKNIVSCSIIPHNKGFNWKRKIMEVMDDDDWSLQPEKRFKAIYYGVAGQACKRKSTTAHSEPPRKIKINSGNPIDLDMRTGLVTKTQNNIRVGGKNVTKKLLFNQYNYRSSGIFSSCPEGTLVENVELGIEKGLKFFYIYRNNRYFRIEENVSIETEAQNVARGISSLDAVAQRAQLDLDLQKMGGSNEL